MTSVARDRTGKALLDAARLAFLLLIASLAWMKHGIVIHGLKAFPSDLLFLVTVVFWTGAMALGQTRLRLHSAFVLLAIYFAAMAVSALFAVDPEVSAFKLLTQLYLLSLPVLAFNLVRTEIDLRSVFAWWLVPAVAVGVYGVATLLLFPFIGWHSFLLEPLHHFGTLPPGPYPRIELTFEFPSMLANYLGVSLMFLLLAHSRGWISRGATLACSAVLLISAFFGLTPGFGGILAMLALWVWYLERPNRPGIARTALVAAFGLTVLEILVAAVTPIIGPTAPFLIHVPGLAEPIAPAVRLQTWTAALQNFFASPLFGHGIGVRAVEVLYQAPEDSGPGLVTDAHNFILSVAAQCGILGLAAVAAIGWFVIREARGAALPNRRNPLMFGLSIAWLSGFVIQGIVGSFEDARHLWVLFGLIAAASRFDVGAAEVSTPATH